MRWVVSHAAGHDPGPARLLSQIIYWFGGGGGRTRTRIHHDLNDWIAESVRDWATELATTPRTVARWFDALQEAGRVVGDTRPWRGRTVLHVRLSTSELQVRLRAAVDALGEWRCALEDIFGVPQD